MKSDETYVQIFKCHFTYFGSLDTNNCLVKKILLLFSRPVGEKLQFCVVSQYNFKNHLWNCFRKVAPISPVSVWFRFLNSGLEIAPINLRVSPPEETHFSPKSWKKILEPKWQPLTPLTHVPKWPGDPQLSFFCIWISFMSSKIIFYTKCTKCGF